MKLNDIIQDLRFDKRIIEWGVRYKIISREEYQKHLQSLTDLSDQKEDLITLDQMEQSEESSLTE